MNWLAILVGIFLIGLAMTDGVWTTLTTGGGGPITTRLSRWLWRSALFVERKRSTRSHRLLLGLGTFILLMIMTVWIVLLWAGWTFLFSADPASVVNVQTGEPADLWSLIYFTGYTIFTLGVGNFVPQGGHWEVLTAVAALNGLSLITIAITYLVPVLSAASQKRQLAATACDLGCTPSETLTRAWTGTGFDGLANYLAQLVPLIELHAQRHAAYPILHYFHSPLRRTAVSPSLAALDEALLLLTAAVQPQARLPDSTVEPVRSALAELLSTLHRQYIHEADEPPPIPDLRPLKEAGIPVVDEQVFRQAVEERSPHRRLLRAFVESDGWSWDDVRG